MNRIASRILAGQPQAPRALRTAQAIAELHERRCAEWAAWQSLVKFTHGYSNRELSTPGSIFDQATAMRGATRQAYQASTIAEARVEGDLNMLYFDSDRQSVGRGHPKTVIP